MNEVVKLLLMTHLIWRRSYLEARWSWVSDLHTSRLTFIVFNGIPIPKTSSQIDKKYKATHNTTIKSKGFRIKKNKTIKKRLFSANNRENTENQPQNSSLQSFKPLRISRGREKPTQLPPLGKYLNGNLNDRIENSKFFIFTYYRLWSSH